MQYKELQDLDDMTEIDSVGAFISEIKALRDSVDGTSTEMYFRGQKTEFWNIEPSIFRNDMLSIEHILMQIPLQKIPMEFSMFNTTFDILTKYQHYGMCTRLLDLTTNPLVALYFACKTHGYEEYECGDEITKKEPYGVIYYTNNYYKSQHPNDIEIKIISALANYDLSKENTIAEILNKLRRDKIIDKDMEKKWLQKEHFKDFIKILQSNYMVTPSYTNERLRGQSGVFLLAGMFSVAEGKDIGNYIVSKSKGNLRKEFSKNYFYIKGENKEIILKELDLYNINEATLFPELEHQLNYIRYINKEQTQTVSVFSKYDENDRNIEQDIILDDDKLNRHITEKLHIILDNIVEAEDFDEIKSIITNGFTIDWYKRDSALSKIRMPIMGYYFVKTKNKEIAIRKSNEIVDGLKKEVKIYKTNQD